MELNLLMVNRRHCSELMEPQAALNSMAPPHRYQPSQSLADFTFDARLARMRLLLLKAYWAMGRNRGKRFKVKS